MIISARDYLPMAERQEGRLTWMYLDTRRNVTVGIGHLLSTAADAEALPFVEGKTGRPATPGSIGAAFEAVEAAQQLAARGATGFERVSDLRLPDTAVLALFEDDFGRIVGRTRVLFEAVGGGLDSYPKPAQLAVVDMAFNLGPDGLYDKYPKFRNDGLALRDFAAAAGESHRNGISATRNAETRSLLLEAARIEKQGPVDVSSR